MFKTKEEALTATQANGESLDGLTLRVTLSAQKSEDFKTTIFVGNLPFICEDEELRNFFESFGKVDYVRIIRDPMTQSTKGFGYVKFQDKKDWANLMSIVLAKSLQETKKLFKRFYKPTRPKTESAREETQPSGLDTEGQIIFKARALRIKKAKKTLVKSRQTRFQKNREEAPKKGTGPKMTQEERRENKKNLKAISRGVRMGTGGYDANLMQNVIRNQVVAPQSLVSKRIKKIKRNVNLSKEEKVKLILKAKKVQADKLKEEVIETEGLLAKRRAAIKKKKRFNAIAAKKAMQK